MLHVWCSFQEHSLCVVVHGATVFCRFTHQRLGSPVQGLELLIASCYCYIFSDLHALLKTSSPVILPSATLEIDASSQTLIGVIANKDRLKGRNINSCVFITVVSPKSFKSVVLNPLKHVGRLCGSVRMPYPNKLLLFDANAGVVLSPVKLFTRFVQAIPSEAFLKQTEEILRRLICFFWSCFLLYFSQSNHLYFTF